MNRLQRYIARYLMIAAVLSTAGLACTIWLTQALKLINLIIDGGAPFRIFIALVLLTLPTFLSVVLPIGVVTGVLFTYNRLITDSELVVMRAAGVSPYALARPALMLAALATIIMFGLNLWLAPAANRELVYLQDLVKSQFSTVLLREGVFNDVGEGLTVYLRERSGDGEMYGLLIHDTRTKGKAITVIAKNGHLAEAEAGTRLIVFNGDRQEVDRATGHLSQLFFDQYTLDLQMFQPQFAKHWNEPRERSLTELMNPDMNDPDDLRNLGRISAELHMRLSTPFFALGFSMVALACLLSGDFSRRGIVKRIMAAALIIIALQGAGLTLINLAAKNPLLVPLLYAAALLPIFIGGYYLRPRLRAVPPPPPGMLVGG